jgi:hypothetical protein
MEICFVFIKFLLSLITEKIQTMHSKFEFDQSPLALQGLRFVFYSLHLLQAIHIRLHDLSIGFHYFRDIGFLNNCRQFLALRLHSDYAEVFGWLRVLRSAFSWLWFIDAII